ncbi:MAG: RagB/SusD family nutrient uptake outer membrane protein, partial [Algoriphagus sp. 32-45-6]
MILGGTLALGSCDLDVEPRQSLTPEAALATVNGYQSLIFATYGMPRGFNQYGQQMMIAPEIMADNLRIIANTGRYIGQEANADRAHIGLWNTGYWGGINNT